MGIVGGFDLHRRQITFDFVDTATGEASRGQIKPATRAMVREWLTRFDGLDAAFVMESTTGWRFVTEELRRAGVEAHVAEPAEARALRGTKRRAKTDRADARHLRDLLVTGTVPESWIPTDFIADLRTKARVRKALIDQRSGWMKRIHAQLFQHGLPEPPRLTGVAGRRWLAAAELPPTARQVVNLACEMIDILDDKIAVLDGSPPSTEEMRGRPRIRSDDEILRAALRAFAAAGFDAMSLRLLNRDLGLSHGTINQRFGSKERLYYAAIDYGFGGLVAEITDELERPPEPGDDLALVWESIRAFLVASARRPGLVRLMHEEGLADSDRLDYIFETFIAPTLAGIDAAYDRLAEAGRVRPLSSRARFFLIAHGAAAPFTLTALSRRFDVTDGPLDDAAHVEQMTDVIIAGLRT